MPVFTGRTDSACRRYLAPSYKLCCVAKQALYYYLNYRLQSTGKKLVVTRIV